MRKKVVRWFFCFVLRKYRDGKLKTISKSIIQTLSTHWMGPRFVSLSKIDYRRFKKHY